LLDFRFPGPYARKGLILERLPTIQYKVTMAPQVKRTSNGVRIILINIRVSLILDDGGSAPDIDIVCRLNCAKDRVQRKVKAPDVGNE
jgi:hypothetical protein